MKQKSRTLTEQELEIMKVVWDLGDGATVRQVYEKLREERQVAYTTVMTMMNILESKGYLGKEPVGRAYLYEPTRPRQQVISGLVEDFLERVFDGSARPLLLNLVKDQKVSPEDLEEIAEIIENEP